MKIIIYLFCVLSLSACLKIKDKEKDEAKIDLVIQKQEPQAQIVANPEPQSYRVRLPIVDHTQAVQRTDLKDSKSQILTMNLEEGYFVDAGPVSGHEYKYELGYMESGSLKVLATFQVLIPVDLVFEGEKILTEATQWKYGRVFFKKDSRLKTLNFALRIQADEIISDGGIIETFPASSPAAVDARSGSNIFIQAKTGRGLMNVYLRGENGADATDTRIKCQSPVEPRDGRNGGHSGQLNMVIEAEHQLQINIVSQQGRGGNGFSGIEYCGGSVNINYNGRAGSDGQIQISCIQDFRGQHCF